MPKEKKILIVEDDEDISMVEEAYLEAAGFETKIVTDGMKVAETLENGDFALILLELMLPGKSGYEVCREIRDKWDIPILMVTARTESMDKIRIQDLRILVDSWKVYKGDQEIRFPNREFELLKFLALHPNIVFSNEQLFEKIWGYDYADDSATVMMHINRIRKKIEDDSKNPKILETVWGAGYRLNK
ncbi:response regulator transcription factor [Roseburia sp. BX0805]|uniref:Stage 0 sporulation protein A homolog n=1 Tax=Roseburia yibonii TaxID=2763063 RepID=A0ABR7I7B3_9FIRM|nr:response regulator transcription factor [Roseburia yibonii]MBC5752835.1 response regulator transcription factor [Roseburia yibonii]